MSRIKKITYKGINFDSKQEYEFGRYLEDRGVNLSTCRESEVLEYIIPEQRRKYYPDFTIGGVQLEFKGRLTKADRDKLLQVRQSNPKEWIILVFSRSANRIRKGSQTTYGDWATKNGFEWYDSTIPESRLNEIIDNANKKRKTNRK